MTAPAIVALPWLVTCLAVLIAIWYYATAERWRRRADWWMCKAIHAGYVPEIRNPAKVLADIFAPSTERDVRLAREAREYRALKSIDHHTRHRVEGFLTDSEAATEILQFCVGGWEKDV